MVNPQQQSASPSRAKQRLIWLAVAAILFLIPAVALGIRTLTGGNELPRLTRAEYEAAQKKWADSGITGYDLDLNFGGGDQRKFIHVEVRDGQVTKCLDNGVAVPNEKRWNDWTVDNQFLMIADDLTKSEDPKGGFAVKSNVMITLHAEFEPQYGYPLSYWRKARGNTPLQSRWVVTEFTPIFAK